MDYSQGVAYMSDFLNVSAGENARFFGRTVKTEDGITFFNWSGSGFVFRFRGTAARCVLHAGVSGNDVPQPADRGYIGVYLDGLPYCTARFPIDRQVGEYILAEGLPFGEHTVCVIKETEAAYGRAGVSQIMTDGEILTPPPQAKLRLEFIGDSITCGYGNICSNASPDFVTAEENFSQTYAAVAARILDAEISVVAASGNGFYHDYGCNTHNLIPELYCYTDKFFHGSCGVAPEKWDFKKDRKDAVIIKLGANDYQFCSGADLPEEQRSERLLATRRLEFTDIASAFFRKVSKCRPGTPIIFIYESDIGLKNELLEAVKKANAGIHTMEIMPKRPYEGVGANGHFSVFTHARVGELLAAEIRRIIC